ncbi:vWA domain-containing protein [Jatrophihabitans fulvus]
MTISLEKRTADAEASLISLLKTQQSRGIDLGELVAQVEIAIDYSGSMMGRYRGRNGEPGEVQTVVERALALSLSGLDDDGVVPVHFFHHQAFPPEAVDRSNYQGFVDQWMSGNRMGGTAYGPTIRNILGSPPKAQRRKKLFGRGQADVPAPAGPDPTRLEAEKDEPPKFVIFVTDGAPADQAETVRLLVEAAARPIFWQFIGLGYSPRFLEQLDTMGGRVVDNVGLTEFKDTLEMTDQQFFDAIISEFFTSWLPEARRLGVTRR